MTTIYCQFIDGNISTEELPKLCKPYIGETNCTHCDKSPLLATGVTAEDLKLNLKCW